MDHHVYLYGTSWGKVELLSPILQVGLICTETHKTRYPTDFSTWLRPLSRDIPRHLSRCQWCYESNSWASNTATGTEKSNSEIVQCQCSLRVLRKQQQCLVSAADILQTEMLTHGLQDGEHVVL